MEFSFFSSISLEVAKVLGAVRRVKPICTHRTLITNYKPFTLSYFDYCSAVVLSVLVFVKKLKKCKIGGVRIISASHCWVRSGQILPDHNLVSLVNRRGEQMKTLMF